MTKENDEEAAVYTSCIGADIRLSDLERDLEAAISTLRKAAADCETAIEIDLLGLAGLLSRTADDLTNIVPDICPDEDTAKGTYCADCRHWQHDDPPVYAKSTGSPIPVRQCRVPITAENENKAPYRPGTTADEAFIFTYMGNSCLAFEPATR